MVLGVPAPIFPKRASSAIPGAARVSQLPPMDQLPPVAFHVVTALSSAWIDKRVTIRAAGIRREKAFFISFCEQCDCRQCRDVLPARHPSLEGLKASGDKDFRQLQSSGIEASAI